MERIIAIGCDHGGYEIKEAIKKYLDENLTDYINVIDHGCHNPESVDYPDIAHALCGDVESGEAELGILICGSGNGINMAANSHKGVRSALCWRSDVAALARQHNNANVMALPGRFITESDAINCVKEFIDNDDPLLLANSDQFMEWNSNECLYAFNADGIDAGILTFKATHPKWSYAKVGEDGFVSEVAEKKPISDDATVGVYFWKKGSDYVKYAKQMIEKDVRVNNEFYICPVFNEAIADGKKIRIKEIEGMWGIGTPEDLNYFLEHYRN